MNEHTKRILNRMRSFLAAYERENLSLRSLVDNLEGSIQALDEGLPSEFQLEWFYHWGNLEQILAAGTEDKRLEEITEEIDALLDLLERHLIEEG